MTLARIERNATARGRDGNAQPIFEPRITLEVASNFGVGMIAPDARIWGEWKFF